MPPKQSKKAAEKEKQKIIEDKTFGLKNKNRSAKVKAFVQQVQKNVSQGNPNDRKAKAENEKKKDAKEAQRAFEAEMSALFRAVDKEAKPAPGEGDEDKNLGVNPDEYLWTADDFEAVAEDETRLEERLEEERAALKGRTDLTPVTEASFQAWKARKRQEALDKEKARVEKARKTHTLRGKDLWEHDKDLFVDDDEADEFYEREEEDGEAEAVEAAGGVKVFMDPTAM